MPSSTLTSKGQVTIPKEVRKHLEIESGDEIDFVITDQGEVFVKAKTLDIRRLKGFLSRKGAKPITVEQMNQAILRRYRKKS